MALAPEDLRRVAALLAGTDAVVRRATTGHIDDVRAAEAMVLRQLAHLPPAAVQLAVAEELARAQEARRQMWLRDALRRRAIHLPDEHLPPVVATTADAPDETAADEQVEHERAAHALVEPRVLVAVDGSAPSLRAVDLAVRLAPSWGCAIDLLAVVDVAPDVVGASMFRSGLHDEARTAALISARARIAVADAVVHTRLLRGRVATVLLQEAALPGVVLLVVGRRGKGDERAFTPGSVSRALTSHAPVPTLVVP